MQGVCSCCGEINRELAKCPRCGLYIGLCCYVVKLKCCIACKLELEQGDEA